MPSDYKQITKDNMRRRGEEFDDIGRFLSEQLYSDKTHFVYELLQNAEDALERCFRDSPQKILPCSVKFLLFKDRLEYRHFGQPFDEHDVRGISDVLKGTKSEDRTQIGKFGIGFKSVYAFTSTPQIHSGDEHFVIKRYIRPEAAEPCLNIKEGETLFIFPFDHKNLSQDEAFELILHKLRNLGPRVLLFLNRIDEIEWSADPVEENGQYLKESKKRKKARQVTVIGQNNGQNEDENWLIFERPITVSDRNDSVRVEIGFRLETSTKDQVERITKLNDARLVVYFPTGKETRFGFLIQGPYRTTPSRDNIPKDDNWNKTLVLETAHLLTDALRNLKEMGLLSISLLKALPIRMDDDFPEVFYPIVSEVHDALINEELLPADDGTFVSAQNTKLARGADLRKLLNQDQLCSLFQSTDAIKWLSGEITRDLTPDLWTYLINELDIELVTRDKFAQYITTHFLGNQSNKWFLSFYVYLSTRKSLWEQGGFQNPSILRNKEIIRLSDNTHVQPFDKHGQPNAYLPSLGGSEHPEIMEALTTDEKALEFLKKLGLRKVGEQDIIKSILESYYIDNASAPSLDNHIKHIKRFIALFKSINETEMFKGMNLFLDKAQEAYHSPNSYYLDLPFDETDLHALYDNKGLTIPTRVPLWEGYSNIDGFQDYAIKVGVQNKLYINRVGTHKHRDKSQLKCDYNKYNVKWTNTAINDDYSITGLTSMLNKPTIELSRFLWRTMSKADPCVLRARFRPNQQYETRSAPSTLVYELKDAKWIPTRDGEFRRPAEVTRKDLLDNFQYDDRNGWLTTIAFGEEEVKATEEYRTKIKSADMLGVSLDDTDFIKQHREEFQEWKSVISAQNDKPIFPTRKVANPERRKERITKQLSDTPEKKYEPRTRAVRITEATQYTRIWLKEQYTNDAGKMVCQICKQEMPFRKRDGEHYFEAVEALSREHFTMEHEAQFLALCPLCAAMYKEFVKQNEEAMVVLKNALMNTDNCEVQLHLGELDTSIRFVETHRNDIRTIIQEMG